MSLRATASRGVAMRLELQCLHSGSGEPMKHTRHSEIDLEINM